MTSKQREEKKETKIPSKFYIAEGLVQDCDIFCLRFLEKDSLSFTTFSDLWKSLKMGQIFLGRPSSVELMEFTEEALLVAKKMFMQAVDFKKQVFGLYMMYAFYYKQPFKMWEKLKFTSQECENLYDFKQTLKARRHLEPLYILCKMLSDGAIKVYLSERNYAADNLHRTYCGGFYTRRLNTFCSRPSSHDDDLVESESSNSHRPNINLTSLHKELQDYKESKRDIKDSKGNPLEIVNTEFAADMIEKLKTFNVNRESAGDEGNIKRNLKEKAYKSIGMSSNPRYRQENRKNHRVESDDTADKSESDEDAGEKTVNPKKRNCLKHVQLYKERNV